MAKRECYAYTPTDQESDWKLPLCDDAGALDARMVGNAVAALGPGGFRGNRVAIPDADLPGVKAKVRAAWKKLNPDKGVADVPAAIKASEETAAFADEPFSSMKAFLGKMYELLKGKVPEEDWNDAVKKARGHAGGKAKAARIVKHAEDHPALVAGCDLCMGGPGPVEKLAKADAAVNYREVAVNPADALAPQQRCFDCRFYQWGACQLVEGSIEADWVCDLYHDPVQTVPSPLDLPAVDAMNMAEVCGADGPWHLFNEIRAYGEPPTRLNYLPKPGRYTHSSHGTIDLTRETNAQFVANFRKRVYGQDIPIDAEHDLKASGAVGYITDLVLNEDGSVDAIPTWNERGTALLKGDRFRYFSPEYAPAWRDPVTGEVHPNVPIGGAITTRPFFKEKALRPLVASEDGHLFAPDWEPDAGTPVAITFRELAPVEAAGHAKGTQRMTDKQTTETVALSEAEVRAFRDWQATRATQEAELAELRTFREGATQRFAEMEKARRVERFTAEVRGKSDENGTPWLGDTAKHVDFLVGLSETFGEEDDRFKFYVAQQRATAEQARTAARPSSIFGEIGSGQPASANPVADEVRSLAEAKVAADPKLTIEMAERAVYLERSDLFARTFGG